METFIKIIKVCLESRKRLSENNTVSLLKDKICVNCSHLRVFTFSNFGQTFDTDSRSPHLALYKL